MAGGTLAVTPREFIARWHNSALKERSAAQQHFLDLCRLLDEPTPAEADPTGRDYAFEVGASKTTGGRGFADVFKRGHFGWEYKGTKANLDVAFAQLQRYAIALDNPPLLIVSDIGTTIRIHTNWTNSVSKVYGIAIAELENPEKRGWLKAALSDPDALRPAKTRQQLTEEVAGEFARLARSLRERGHDPERVAHFINRLVFCMFAEDVKLLPDGLFTRMLERAHETPEAFEAFARDLFVAMKSPGGRIGFERIAWFNGGLFDDDLAFALTREEIAIVRHAASQYWGDIDPSILGTLFERGLDPDKRSQLGAHYTDRDKIMMIVNPVIVEPLTREWEAARAEIADLMGKAGAGKGVTTRARNRAQAVLDRFLKRLAGVRVLDPACGSGNFLYLALRALKDLEHRAQVEAEALGLPRAFPRIGPEVVKGIEINPYAAELARVSVWIGEIQWMLKNGFAAAQNPVLKPLDTIECRDAILNGDGTEAKWPDADVAIGNPPFLGDKLMRDRLGSDYTDMLRATYAGRVPGGADLVCYWFEKAREQINAGTMRRAGLVATNSIRGGANRIVLDRIADTVRIFDAWADEDWTVDGAAVRVSLVSFVRKDEDTLPIRLDGRFVPKIFSDLTAGADDLTRARALDENDNVAFNGVSKKGKFDIEGKIARSWLTLPLNPNGKSNAYVLCPWINGIDVVRRPQDRWLIHFNSMAEQHAALFEAPYAWVLEYVRPDRCASNSTMERRDWWLLARRAPAMQSALTPLSRYIVTPEVAKHRVFIWVDRRVVPDKNVVVIARDDEVTFGILHSQFHAAWSLRLGTTLEDRPRYTSSTTFRTFPFPEGLTPDIPAANYAADPRAIAIAAAARRLDELRENWLNPADLVRREPEVVPGFPDRVLPIDDEAARILKKRTLTNLYNERPAWLGHAHRALDEAVAAAYGWPAGITDDDALARLFALNQDRARRSGGEATPKRKKAAPPVP